MYTTQDPLESRPKQPFQPHLLFSYNQLSLISDDSLTLRVFWMLLPPKLSQESVPRLPSSDSPFWIQPEFNNYLQITCILNTCLQKTLQISLSDQLFNLGSLKQSLYSPIFNFTEKGICKSSCCCFIQYLISAFPLYLNWKEHLIYYTLFFMRLFFSKLTLTSP